MAIVSPTRSFRIGDQRRSRIPDEVDVGKEMEVEYRISAGIGVSQEITMQVHSVSLGMFCFVRVPPPVPGDAGASTAVIDAYSGYRGEFLLDEHRCPVLC